MSKKTLIIGASTNPERYSYKALLSLQNHGHEVLAAGIQEGELNGVKFITDKKQIADIDTVTLYVGPKNQTEWIPYVLQLKPNRLVFNPGTENPDFFQLATAEGIECIEACTLVMLGIGNY
ncbi:MAG: CoA-binding protein [Sphingobacteriaceae bacterium]|nr:CoA-binding protein [Sphingobacteriaceae bacterium]